MQPPQNDTSPAPKRELSQDQITSELARMPLNIDGNAYRLLLWLSTLICPARGRHTTNLKIATIADHFGWSRSTAQRAIAQLVENNLARQEMPQWKAARIQPRFRVYSLTEELVQTLGEQRESRQVKSDPSQRQVKSDLSHINKELVLEDKEGNDTQAPNEHQETPQCQNLTQTSARQRRKPTNATLKEQLKTHRKAIAANKAELNHLRNDEANGKKHDNSKFAILQREIDEHTDEIQRLQKAIEETDKETRHLALKTEMEQNPGDANAIKWEMQYRRALGQI